jgi:type IV pilus assembly protein PilE
MRSRNTGITLIELITVVAIVGILAAIAYPTYRKQVLRSGRAEAKAALMQWAQSLEKCYTRFGSYNDAECSAKTNLTVGALTERGLYRVAPLGAIGAMTFALTATPQGGQAADTECMTFMMDQSGLRAVSGPGGTQRCW